MAQDLPAQDRGWSPASAGKKWRRDPQVSYYCALEIFADSGCSLGQPALEAAILREYIKEGKVVQGQV
jgi:hypothetical protein